MYKARKNTASARYLPERRWEMRHRHWTWYHFVHPEPTKWAERPVWQQHRLRRRSGPMALALVAVAAALELFVSELEPVLYVNKPH